MLWDLLPATCNSHIWVCRSWALSWGLPAQSPWLGWSLHACFQEGWVGGQLGAELQCSVVCATTELGWLQMNPRKVRNKHICMCMDTYIYQLQRWLCIVFSLSTKCMSPCGIQSQDPCIHLCVWTQSIPCAQGKWLPLPSRKVPWEMDPLLTNSPSDLLFPQGRKLESPRGNQVLFFRWDTRQSTEVWAKE